MNRSEVRSPETSLTWLGRLVADGAHDDWERLIAVYEPLLKMWALRAGVEESACDDLSQEVMLVVVRRIGEFEREHVGAFRGWLRAILANFLKKYFRDRPQIVCRIDIDAVAQTDSHLGRELDREHDEFMTLRAMHSVQGDFSAATWSAFQQQVVDGLPPAQVAATLGLSLNAVLKAKGRVLNRLRKELNWLIE